MIGLLIENTLLGKIDKVQIAIDRIREFQNRNEGKKNILAFSGGKDSIVVYDLMKRSGIEFEAIYSPTSVDPPELIYYIKKHHPEVKFAKYKHNKNWEGYNEVTMWNLLRHRAIPPTRIVRYCCDELKERTGDVGDTIFTGVRWEESKKRSKQSMVGFWKKKIMVRPIIDWTKEEIWEYIYQNGLPYCELYDKGWERLGCIGCPLSSNQIKELELYPKYKENYIKAFDGMVEYRKSKGMDCSDWETGQDIYDWWIGEIKKSKDQIDNQCSMF